MKDIVQRSDFDPNRWDSLYFPTAYRTCDRWNQKLSIPLVVGIAAAALGAYNYSADIPFLSPEAVTGLGVVAVSAVGAKALLFATSRVQRAVQGQTSLCKKIELQVPWLRGWLNPPNSLEAQIASHNGAYYQQVLELDKWDVERCQRVPRMAALKAKMPSIKSEADREMYCEKLMENVVVVGAQIVEEVRNPVHDIGSRSKEELVALQSRIPLKSSGEQMVPWLYKGFFTLPHAYRTVFHASDDPNWKALFFQEGTKQCEWRQQYNQWCDEMFTLVDRHQLQAEDDRFTKNGL